MHSYFSSLSVILIYKSLNLVIWVWNYMMFQYFDGNLRHQVLYRYILPILVSKLEGSALEMHLLWCRTSICSWNVSVEGSLMLEDPFSVSFLCILGYINLCFFQNSMQVTPKWLIPFSASHIILNWSPVFWAAR